MKKGKGTKGKAGTSPARAVKPKRKASSPGGKRVKKPTPLSGGMKKRYLKRTPECRVTFSLCKEAAGDAAEVFLVGDFNNWDRSACPLKKLKNGSHTLTLRLAVGKAYRFRYLIDGERWENDWEADRYESNPFGTDDSIAEI